MVLGSCHFRPNFKEEDVDDSFGSLECARLGNGLSLFSDLLFWQTNGPIQLEGEGEANVLPSAGEELIGKWKPWEESVLDLTDSMLKLGKVHPPHRFI